MKNRVFTILVVFALLMGLAVQPVSAARATNYIITDLGTLGGFLSMAIDINNHGQIVGFSSLSGYQGQHAFLWADGVMTDLGTLGGQTGAAGDINNHGQVAGNSQIIGDCASDDVNHGFLWE